MIDFIPITPVRRRVMGKWGFGKTASQSSTPTSIFQIFYFSVFGLLSLPPRGVQRPFPPPLRPLLSAGCRLLRQPERKPLSAVIMNTVMGLYQNMIDPGRDPHLTQAAGKRLFVLMGVV